MAHDPRVILRAWLPHVALLGLIIAATWWMWALIGPAGKALVLATSLCLLTYPILFLPIDRWMHSVLPDLTTAMRRYFSSLAATTALVTLLIAICLSLLVAIVGDVGGTLHLVVGLALQDEERIQAIVDLLTERITVFAALFPKLNIDIESIRATIRSWLGDVSVGPAMVSYLITGTGGFLAQCALTIVTLFYLYSQGPRLVQKLMRYLPLDDSQRSQIALRFHNTAIHMITGTVARAIVHGITLGALSWAIGDFNPVLVAVGAGFIALLPIAGPTVAWLPLVSVLWSQQNTDAALGLAISAICATFVIDRLSIRLAAHLGTDDLWLSFLLFLAIVGGIIGYGPLGLIFGPAAVLTFSILLQLVPALYGDRRNNQTQVFRQPALPAKELDEPTADAVPTDRD